MNQSTRMVPCNPAGTTSEWKEVEAHVRDFTIGHHTQTKRIQEGAPDGTTRPSSG